MSTAQLAVGAPLASFAYGIYLNYGSNTSSSLLLSIISFAPVLGLVVAMGRAFDPDNMDRSRAQRSLSAPMQVAIVVAGSVGIFAWMRYGVFMFDFIYWFLFAHHPVINASRAAFRAAAVVANASATARIFAASAAAAKASSQHGAALPGVCFATAPAAGREIGLWSVKHTFTRQSSAADFDVYDFYVESVPCTASNAFTAAASDGSATAFKTSTPSSSSSASHHDEDVGANAKADADADDEGESWYASQGKKNKKQAATKTKPTKPQRSDIANTESHVPFEYNPSHDPVYVHKMSEERDRWGAASQFTVRAAAVFPPLCADSPAFGARVPLFNLLSPLDPSEPIADNGDDGDDHNSHTTAGGSGRYFGRRDANNNNNQVLLDRRQAAAASASEQLPMSAFFFEGHAMGAAPVECATSLQDQALRVHWRIERVVAVVAPNWLRSTLNLLWNIAVNVAWELFKAMMEGENRDRRSSGMPAIWNTEKATIEAKVTAEVQPNGELALSLSENFNAESQTTLGPGSILPLTWRKNKGSAGTSSTFASADALSGGRQQQQLREKAAAAAADAATESVHEEANSATGGSYRRGGHDGVKEDL